MTDIIKDIFKEINILDTQSYQNMTVTGLNIPDSNIDLMTLETGFKMGLVEITELNESGIVGEVKVTNNAVTPLLILDGEEIIGSKQNRIVNSTIIIPPKSEKTIPVSCVEEGRWNYETTKFNYSNHMATSKLRKDKQSSVSQSLRNENTYKSDQIGVWDNVRNTIDSLNVESNTNALIDSFNQKRTEIQDYKNEFKKQENQNGIIVYINGKLAGFEIIYNTAKYKQYHEKLIESYIMDAIQMQKDEYEYEDISHEDLIDKIIGTPREIYDSVGEGIDYRIEDEDISGSLILYNNMLINGSFFKKEEI